MLSEQIAILTAEQETIEIPVAIPDGYVIAATAIATLEAGKYYAAYLDYKTNNVYIGPKVTETTALSIVIANNENFGVFTWSGSAAVGLVSKLGPSVEHGPHRDQPGYYKHYHVIWPKQIEGNTHVWYFF